MHYAFGRGFEVYAEGKNLSNSIARTYLNGNPYLPWAPGQDVGASASGVGSSGDVVVRRRDRRLQRSGGAQPREPQKRHGGNASDFRAGLNRRGARAARRQRGFGAGRDLLSDVPGRRGRCRGRCIRTRDGARAGRRLGDRRALQQSGKGLAQLAGAAALRR